MMHPPRVQLIVALNPKGRALMTRDMELIRKIFAEIQKRKDADLRTLEIPGIDEVIVARHLEMLLADGLVEGEQSYPIEQSFPIILVKDLSWSGHDFAAVLANDSVWAKLKKTFSVSELETLPLGIIKDAGKGLLAQWVKSKLGL
jgi:hypothetical protein